MERISLAQFADREGQDKAARLLGVYQSAISKALAVGRNITVTIADDGSIEAEEIRPFPSSRRQLNAA